MYTRLMRGEKPIIYAIIDTHMGKRVYSGKEMTCSIAGALETSARVLSFGSFERTSQPVSDDILAAYTGKQLQHIDLELDNADKYFSKLIAKEPFLSRTLTIKVGFEDEAESVHMSLFSGTITEVSALATMTIEAEETASVLSVTYQQKSYAYQDIAGTWTKRAPFYTTDTWLHLASDSSGRYLYACSPSKLAASSDYGVTWASIKPSGAAGTAWKKVACSTDGSKVIACEYGGRVWISTNYGSTWTDADPLSDDTNHNWSSVASDSDGSVLVASRSGAHIYVSTNSGADWTERDPGSAGHVDWDKVTCSGDGAKIMAAYYTSGKIYASTDTGANWSQVKPFGEGATGGIDDIFISNDGSTFLACSKAFYCVMRSTNDGAAWTDISPVATTQWTRACSDYDYSHIMLASYHPSSNGLLYYSDDGGTIWKYPKPEGAVNSAWGAVAMDQDGTNFIVAVSPGYIYTSAPATDHPKLPIGYGDMTDGLSGIWELPIIDHLTYTYAFLGHEVISMANGNNVTIYADGVPLAASNYAFDELNDYQGLGTISTITFTSDRSATVITAQGKGKPTTTGGSVLIDNIIDIIYDFLTVENDFTSSLFDASMKARSKQVFTAQAYKAAGVINSEKVIWDIITEMMASFLGNAYLDGSGNLSLEIDDGTVNQTGNTIIAYGITLNEAKMRLENLINQCPAKYRYNYIDSEFKGETDSTDHADLASQGIYGVRKPTESYQFYWCRDLTSIQKMQDIIVNKLKDPLYEIDIEDLSLKYMDLDLGSFFAMTADSLYDEKGSPLYNQIWKVLSVSPDFSNDKIVFRALQTPYYMTISGARDTTKY
jgi:hypothetical protein